ncbi:esterase family protein [Agromyces atrinae]|uniref:alpha/beta hydrolase n=1 Tax=Agromyces atrinae TaxID=592376 RepID=UPI001F57D979|nr:alpha/beta hydrolase-fold protein [Agromyces atrinae]MCI2956156.1 esterase family protein [Agromyces atrinae]
MDSLNTRWRRSATALGGAALIAASLVVATPATADPASPSTVSIDLEGTWKFSYGDDAAFADPGFDDSGWADTQVPGDGAEFANYDGFGWYRLTFDLPAEAAGTNLVASLGFLDDVDEAFLNGVRIGGSGSMPPNASSQWFEKRLYPVPASAPVFGGENVLSVRLYDMNGGGGWYEGPVGIFSKDAVRSSVYGIEGSPASAEQTSAVTAVLEKQRAALASGDVDAFVATLGEDYFHDGRSRERREREIRSWIEESGSLTLLDGEVEVIVAADGTLIVDTNRSITGTRDGGSYAFQPAAQQFLRFSPTTGLEAGNASRFFRETVDSELEGSAREFVTYLPPSYLTEPNRQYPVVYLFHGINGGSREWEPRDMDDVLDGLWADGLAESIVVMPDGESLWYADQPNGGVPWRSMFLTEMMPLVDAEYRTLDSRDFRAITGISMGGFGAYSIGLSNPEKFSSLASHIGALSFSSAGLPTPLAQVGAMSTEQLSQYDFYYDACEFDEYRFDNAVRSMDTLLTAKGIDYTSIVYPEGRHNDACWLPNIGSSFTVHSDHFRAAGLVEDAVAPAISIDLGVAPNERGWFAAPVTVTLSVTDARDEAPLVEYRFGEGEWATYTEPIVVADDGRHLLEIRATDAAGNVGTLTQTIDLDATLPTAAADLDEESRTLTLSGSDALSGIHAIEYTTAPAPTARAVDPGAADGFVAYTEPVVFDADAAEVRYRAIDAAGNVSAEGTVSIPAAVTTPTPTPGEPTPGTPTPGTPGGTPAGETPGGSLVSTGFDPMPFLGATLLLALLGGAFIALRRRRATR